ncbi:MAG: tetratricopeptide repeat protein [Candidatus Omnitrophica bacterium]|nr:tetratricopeptide repeat protein [Candidatus Omnitrophota bacterium]
MNIFLSFASARYISLKMAGDPKRPVLYFSFIVLAFFPVIGLPAGIFLFMSYAKWCKAFKSGLYEEYEEYINEDDETADFSSMYVKINKKIREEISFDTYADIMKWGEAKDKMKVISKISANPTKDEMHIIKDGVNDELGEVRFFSSGALMKIESKLTDEINEVAGKVKRRGMVEDYRQLGDLYARYVELDLPPEDLKNYYLNLACSAYKSSLDIDPQQMGVVIDYAKCLISLKENKKALEILDQAMNKWPGNNDVLFLKSNLFFNEARYGEVASELKKIAKEDLADAKREVAEIWE